MTDSVKHDPHLLVVDDHDEIRDLLADYLGKQGFRVATASGGIPARKLLRTQAFDLVILDIMMPGEDGFSLCHHLRTTGDMPVILLTAMGEESDRIVGLELGADDYVVKPFNPRELLARIKAVLRRTHSPPPGTRPPEGEKFVFGPWCLHVDRRELVGGDGVGVPLGAAEFTLLKAFLLHPNRILSRDRLLDLTRGRDSEVFDRSIDNQVSRLRRKIEADPKHPTLIKTVWGGGYQLTVPVASV